MFVYTYIICDYAIKGYNYLFKPVVGTPWFLFLHSLVPRLPSTKIHL